MKQGEPSGEHLSSEQAADLLSYSGPEALEMRGAGAPLGSLLHTLALAQVLQPLCFLGTSPGLLQLPIPFAIGTPRLRSPSGDLSLRKHSYNSAFLTESGSHRAFQVLCMLVSLNRLLHVPPMNSNSV